MVHGEDLVRLNGGSGSSAHFVWGHRAQQDRPELGPANKAWQSLILYALYGGSSAHTYRLHVSVFG